MYVYILTKQRRFPFNLTNFSAQASIDFASFTISQIRQFLSNFSMLSSFPYSILSALAITVFPLDFLVSLNSHWTMPWSFLSTFLMCRFLTFLRRKLWQYYFSGFPRTPKLPKLNPNHQWLHTINPNSTKTNPNSTQTSQDSTQTNPNSTQTS